VKDWSLDAMQYFVHHPNGTPPRLMGEKNGIRFSIQHDSPIEKVQLYKEEIHNLYCRNGCPFFPFYPKSFLPLLML
jgi:hypothetical protein